MRIALSLSALVFAAAGCADGSRSLPPVVTEPPGVAEAPNAQTEAPVDPPRLRFEVTSTVLNPGGTVVVSGSDCPPDPNWADDAGSDFFVVIGASEVSSASSEPTIHDPAPGHVSFMLVPEHGDSKIAEAIPDVGGDWSARWPVPESFIGVRTFVSALCIGGSGLEAGFVHYGWKEVTVDNEASQPVGRLPTTRRAPDSEVDDPNACRLAGPNGLAFFRVHSRNDSGFAPPCIRAAVTDRLSIDNESGETILVDLGETVRAIASDAYDEFEGARLQDFLEIGVHHLSDDLPDIWVVDPADSPFGAVTQMTLRSFGPLRTDMTVREAEVVLGVDLVSIQEDVEGCTFVAPAGPPDPYAPDLQVFGDDEDGRIVRIETFSPALMTPSGVRVGQSESMLRATYGDRLLSSPDEYMGPENPNYEYVPVDEVDAGFRLMFGTNDDIIESMWTATTDAAYLGEGCA